MKRFGRLLLLIVFTLIGGVSIGHAQDVTSSLIQLLLMANGSHSTDWGTQTNTNMQKIENAIAAGTALSTTGGATTLTDDQNRSAFLNISGTLGSDATITVPSRNKWWVVTNTTSGAYVVYMQTTGNTPVAIPTSTAAGSMLVFCDGTNIVIVGSSNLLASNNLSELTATAATARTNLGLGTSSTQAATDFATASSVTSLTGTTLTAGWGLAGGGDLSSNRAFAVSTTAPPFAYDLPINMGLSASASGNALTINLTTASGATPSASNPVLVPFRSTTLATGTPSWAAITSALSITIPSSATLGTTNSVPFRIWVFLEYNAGVPELVVATCSTTSSILPCTSWETNQKTTTTISSGSGTAGVPYATTGVSNDTMRIIGYAEYNSGLATAGTWASAPTTLQLMGPGVTKPGQTIQTVQSNFGTLSVTSFTSLAATNITLAITPTSAANLVKYSVDSTVSNGTANAINLSQIFRGSTAIGNLSRVVGTGAGGGATLANSLVLFGYDAPGSTSAQIYVIKSQAVSGTGNVPAVNTDSAIEILEEIMG